MILFLHCTGTQQNTREHTAWIAPAGVRGHSAKDDFIDRGGIGLLSPLKISPPEAVDLQGKSLKIKHHP